MKHIKTYEELDSNVGDYVILNDIHAYDKNASVWHNLYGIIVGLGKYNFSSRSKPYMVHITSPITSEIWDFLTVHQGLDPDITPIKFITQDYEQDKNDTWIDESFLVRYDSKESWEKEIEKIELEKMAKKYNL